ncbi:PREDICTED: uncharacterized protein LOC109350298 [Lupinus angustifolius]|nr:PREDICTED: uncharacterized protein LOC109350298 [Lupinus angustifolius]
MSDLYYHNRTRRRRRTQPRPTIISQPLSPKTLRYLTLMSIEKGNKIQRKVEDINAYMFKNQSSTSSSCYCSSSQTTSASGNDGVLSGTGESEIGFSRIDLRQSSIAGTVEFYRRHVFLCYKKPEVWPPRIDASEFDRLPRLLHAAVVARKKDMNQETCLTICEGDDKTEIPNGDLLIFPDMIRYRRLTHFDVESFVEEVLVNDGEWLPGKPEALEASYVFVCSHGSHDCRCGVCGPMLVSRFREEVELYGLQGKVFVSPCSNIGVHHDAGNVIIFGSTINGEVTGHWYGYVAPEDVSVLLQQHIIKGKILESLWRGQMGLSENEQKKSQQQRLQLNGERGLKASTKMLMQMNDNEKSTAACRSPDNFVSCCQENDDSSHYQNHVSIERIKNHDDFAMEAKLLADNKSNENTICRINRGKRASRKFRSMSTELDSWEREDTYAAIAVVCAAASVAFAYSCYKQL